MPIEHKEKKLQALRVGYCLSGSHIDSRDLYKKKVRFFFIGLRHANLTIWVQLNHELPIEPSGG